MSYNLRVKHRGKWGKALEGFKTKKEAMKMYKWGYTHYQDYKITKAGYHRKKKTRRRKK